jgi:hypothetical protein
VTRHCKMMLWKYLWKFRDVLNFLTRFAFQCSILFNVNGTERGFYIHSLQKSSIKCKLQLFVLFINHSHALQIESDKLYKLKRLLKTFWFEKIQLIFDCMARVWNKILTYTFVASRLVWSQLYIHNILPVVVSVVYV